MQGLVADIQRCSLHDGPGLRTTVFLKGCPLRCAWCHNPECISPLAEELYYPERCIGCGMCASGCFSGARQECGKRYTPEEVMAQARMDAPYYGPDGGVTLSGGEPLMQPEFSLSILRACRAEGIHTAVETSMFAPWETAKEVLSACDLLMADIKAWDNKSHRLYIGADNRLILENLERTDSLDIPLVIRTPVVPGVNDTEEEIKKIAAFAALRKNLVGYELLPYHPLGLSKAKAVKGWAARGFAQPGPELMRALAGAAASQTDKPVRIAGITLIPM